MHQLPPNGVTIDTTTPGLVWTPSLRAAGYVVEVDDNPDFGTPDVFGVTQSPNYFGPPAQLDPGTHYYWRATAFNPGGYVQGGLAVFSFKVSDNAVDIPAVSTWGIVVLALLILSVGTVVALRRQSSLPLMDA